MAHRERDRGQFLKFFLENIKKAKSVPSLTETIGKDVTKIRELSDLMHGTSLFPSTKFFEELNGILSRLGFEALPKSQANDFLAG